MAIDMGGAGWWSAPGAIHHRSTTRRAKHEAAGASLRAHRGALGADADTLLQAPQARHRPPPPGGRATPAGTRHASASTETSTKPSALRSRRWPRLIRTGAASDAHSVSAGRQLDSAGAQLRDRENTPSRFQTAECVREAPAPTITATGTRGTRRAVARQEGRLAAHGRRATADGDRPSHRVRGKPCRA